MRSSPSEPVARRLSAIAGFYRYATDEDLIDRSPVAGVRRPKVADDSQTTGLDRDQLRAVRALARQRAAAGAGQSSRDLALLTLLAHNGQRLTDAQAVVGEQGEQGQVPAALAGATDLGTERGHRVLHITRKGGRRATVVLAPVTARALDDYLTGRDTGPLFITGGGRRYDEPAWPGRTSRTSVACCRPRSWPRPSGGHGPGLRSGATPTATAANSARQNHRYADGCPGSLPNRQLARIRVHGAARVRCQPPAMARA